MRRPTAFVFLLFTIACATTTPAPEGTADVVAPRVIHKVDPEYPAELRRQGVTGVVTIQAMITKDGLIQNPRVLRGSDPRLEPFALDAVRRWKFRPGTLQGQPVDVLFQVDVSFSIP